MLSVSLCVCVPHSNKMMMMKMMLAVCKPLPKICAKIQPHFLETLLHTKNYVQMRRNTGFVPYDTHHRFATAWCADRDTLLDFVAFRLLELQFSNSLLLCYYKANVRFIFSIQERIFEICRMARIPITFSDLECDFNCPRITYQDSEKRDGYSMSYQYTEGLLKVCLFLFSH